jgi:hypothetical protein
MSNERLRFVILENRLYALDEISNILVIFGDKEKMTQEVINKLEGDLIRATNYLRDLFTRYRIATIPDPKNVQKVSEEFGDYLKQENLVEDDRPFDPEQSRSLMQKFVFKAIGYKPGQCNIGPAERFKRLMTGLIGLIFTAVGASIIILLPISPYWAFTLLIPTFFAFYGIYQYFFKFCVVNGLTKKYDMR